MTEDQNDPNDVTKEIVTADTPGALAGFSLNDLVGRLKEAGLPVAEEAAHALVNTVFDWIEESIRNSDTKVDDFALAILPALRSYIDSKLDSISE